jgi:hypothetical protein
VDPDRDDVPHYFEKIKRPMDLTTVQTNLEHSNYQSLDAWKTDIALIWKNAKDYNGPESLISLMALELATFFQKECELIPKTEWDLWDYRIRKQQQKLMWYLKVNPSVTTSLGTPPVKSGSTAHSKHAKSAIID